MAETLDQRDIDALLKAVDRGQLSVEPAGPDTQSEVTVYDFRRPERVSKDHIRALEALHEAFARTLGASLSTVMRAIVDVRVASIEQCTYSEFILSLPNPTCFFLLGVKPIEGNLILELNPSILFPMLDRLLGGGREPPLVPSRPVTEIERRLVDRLVTRALRALAEAWSAVQEIELAILKMETNPPMVQVLPGGEVVVMVTLEITVGDTSGMMNLCLPFSVVEPLTPRLSRASRLDHFRRQPAEENAGRIAHLIEQAPVELTVYLAETTITVADLMNLRVGDIIKTEKPADETLLVRVGEKPKFRGRPADHRGKKAILITARAGPRDRI